MNPLFLFSLMLALVPWALAIFEKGYLTGLDRRHNPQSVGTVVLFLNGTTLIADISKAALFGKHVDGGQRALLVKAVGE